MNQNNYEIIYVINQEITDFTKLEKLFFQFLENDQIQIKSLGLKKFAYPIKKQLAGHYFQINLKIDAERIKNFIQKIHHIKEILRILVINLDQEKYFKIPKERVNSTTSSHYGQSPMNVERNNDRNNNFKN